MPFEPGSRESRILFRMEIFRPALYRELRRTGIDALEEHVRREARAEEEEARRLRERGCVPPEDEPPREVKSFADLPRGVVLVSATVNLRGGGKKVIYAGEERAGVTPFVGRAEWERLSPGERYGLLEKARVAARTDGLTGLTNRRGYAEDLAGSGGPPVACRAMSPLPPPEEFSAMGVDAQRSLLIEYWSERLVDPLTGLPNRIVFLGEKEEGWFGQECAFSLGTIPWQKWLRNNFGHDSRDLLFIAFAEIWRSVCLESGDPAARAYYLNDFGFRFAAKFETPESVEANTALAARALSRTVLVAVRGDGDRVSMEGFTYMYGVGLTPGAAWHDRCERRSRLEERDDYDDCISEPPGSTVVRIVLPNGVEILPGGKVVPPAGGRKLLRDLLPALPVGRRPRERASRNDSR
jgi:GGDEF domain-containing protein